MPTLQLPDCDLHYQVDDFTDPWTQAGNRADAPRQRREQPAWYAWMPHLARHYRVVRPDMRGFGQSTPMPRDYAWTLDRSSTTTAG